MAEQGLLIVSGLFYGLWDVRLLVLLVIFITSNYSIGRLFNIRNHEYHSENQRPNRH